MSESTSQLEVSIEKNKYRRPLIVPNMPATSNPPTIVHSTNTASASGSDNPAAFGVIDRAERCFITKSVLRTHEPFQWVTAASQSEKTALVSPTQPL
jgi:hypothetical protein